MLINIPELLKIEKISSKLHKRKVAFWLYLGPMWMDFHVSVFVLEMKMATTFQNSHYKNDGLSVTEKDWGPRVNKSPYRNRPIENGVAKMGSSYQTTQWSDGSGTKLVGRCEAWWRKCVSPNYLSFPKWESPFPNQSNYTLNMQYIERVTPSLFQVAQRKRWLFCHI